MDIYKLFSTTHGTGYPAHIVANFIPKALLKQLLFYIGYYITIFGSRD
jgi:hypothetical protein